MLQGSMSCVDLRNAICENLGSLQAGSLSFWGGWFGKPYDNFHRIVGAELLDNTLIVHFDQSETLILDTPRNWSLDAGKLLVGEADRVRFQWFYYGKLPSRESLRFNEYRRTDAGIAFATNFQPARRPLLDPNKPAVQVHAPG